MVRSIYLLLVLCIVWTTCDLTMEEYEQLELETPQLVFQQRAEEDLHEYTPNLKKLVFITPWNKEGQELVLKYANKFDYVSPCWYDLSFNAQHIIIENDKLYNKTYVDLLRAANPNVKILPRIYISSQQRSLLHSIGSFQSKFKDAINLMVLIVQGYHFDGIVWDTPFNTFVAGDKYTSIRNLIVQFVNSIKMNLPYDKLIFFNMANPMGLELSNDMYSILKVDSILIQNYDNDNYLGMLESSINWAKSVKFKSYTSAPFILLLPFFSRRSGQGIDSKQIKRILEKDSRVGSKIQNGICTFYEYDNRIQSYTPCYTYFKHAFKRIEEEKFSVGFWEAGNGLENYYQFL